MAQAADPTPKPDSTEQLEEATPDAVTFSHSGAFRDVDHTGGDREAGFDFTAMHPDDFEALLDQFELPETPIRFEKYLDEMTGERLVWANETVMLVTGANPITGEKVRHNTSDEPKPGYLSAVGIVGEADAVDAVYDYIGKHHIECKGTSPERRCA